MLVDSHVNLHHERFDGEVDLVVDEARAAGVDAMLTISDRISSTDAIKAITARYRNMWRSVGAHPHYASDHLSLTGEELVDLAAPQDVIGIGECGLDFHYTFSPAEDQKRVFAAHIDAAQKTGLPLIIHTRQADREMQQMIAEGFERAPFTPLLHCYTSGPELARYVMEIGGFISFSGILTFKNADDVRAIARETPLDRIIVETDCPYLAPAPFRGRRCDPKHVVEVAAKLAEIRGLSFDEVAALTTANFFRLFKRARFEATP